MLQTDLFLQQWCCAFFISVNCKKANLDILFHIHLLVAPCEWETPAVKQLPPMQLLFTITCDHKALSCVFTASQNNPSLYVSRPGWHHRSHKETTSSKAFGFSVSGGFHPMLGSDKKKYFTARSHWYTFTAGRHRLRKIPPMRKIQSFAGAAY